MLQEPTINFEQVISLKASIIRQQITRNVKTHKQRYSLVHYHNNQHILVRKNMS